MAHGRRKESNRTGYGTDTMSVDGAAVPVPHGSRRAETGGYHSQILAAPSSDWLSASFRCLSYRHLRAGKGPGGPDLAVDLSGPGTFRHGDPEVSALVLEKDPGDN
jgi:hypothetical protein